MYLVYLQSFKSKINHVEEQLLGGKVYWTVEGKIYFTIRFIKANCSLPHFYPLLKPMSLFKGAGDNKNCTSKNRLVTCCKFYVLKCLCGNKLYWKTQNDIQQDKTGFYTLKLWKFISQRMVSKETNDLNTINGSQSLIVEWKQSQSLIVEWKLLSEAV